ncbi:putative gibberellin 3-beta-dioxygenase [Arabidopsis thaliana]
MVENTSTSLYNNLAFDKSSYNTFTPSFFSRNLEIINKDPDEIKRKAFSLKIMAEVNGVIPTIDLEEVNDQILNEKIREASERWGCFTVINHGVSLSLMAEMKKTVRDLHERPYEMKLRNTDVLLGNGYKPLSEFNPFYESFGLFEMASPQAVNSFCDKLDASPDQREILLKYAKATDDLARSLARRLAESYGVVEPNF